MPMPAFLLTQYGGGMFTPGHSMDYAPPLLTELTSGPALHAVKSSKFFGCLAGINGGGISFEDSPNVTIDHCEFESNSAEVS